MCTDPHEQVFAIVNRYPIQSLKSMMYTTIPYKKRSWSFWQRENNYFEHSKKTLHVWIYKAMWSWYVMIMLYELEIKVDDYEELHIA